MAQCNNGLDRTAAARREQTVARVKAAIAALAQRGECVSLRRISAETHAQTPTLPPIAASTIEHNPGAYALYDAAGPERPRSRIRTPHVPHLARLTKPQLIARILHDGAEIRRLEMCLAHALGLDGDADQLGDEPPAAS